MTPRPLLKAQNSQAAPLPYLNRRCLRNIPPRRTRTHPFTTTTREQTIILKKHLQVYPSGIHTRTPLQQQRVTVNRLLKKIFARRQPTPVYFAAAVAYPIRASRFDASKSQKVKQPSINHFDSRRRRPPAFRI